MTTALAMLTDYDYQAEHDESDKKTTWILRSLSGLEMIECTHRGYVDHAEVLHRGLIGWKDFVDSTGKDIPFSEDKISLINALILTDISYEIQNISALTEDERKN